MNFSIEVGSTCFFNGQSLFGCLKEDIFKPNLDAGKQAADLLGFVTRAINETMLVLNQHKLCDGMAYHDFERSEYDYGVLLSDLPHEQVKPWEKNYCDIITNIVQDKATKDVKIIEAAFLGSVLAVVAIAIVYSYRQARRASNDELRPLADGVDEHEQGYGAIGHF